MKNRAFSLIEVVIALGVFAFAIVGIFSLNVIALESARDVKNMTLCMNYTENTWEKWDGFRLFRGTEFFANDKVIVVTETEAVKTVGQKTFYLTELGEETEDINEAVIKVDYETTRIVETKPDDTPERIASRTNMIELRINYSWPPLAPEDSPLRREYKTSTAFVE